MSSERANPLLDGLPLLGDLPDLDGASVLVRVDFNVPLRQCAGEPSVVTDDFRIRAALPTLEYLLAQGASVTACTHLGRPQGAPDSRYDLGPVREELARLAPQVELMENLRFDAGEEQNDPGFVDKLINGHDAYVNDAFGVSHRRHASVVGPPSRLPSAAGFLLQLEIEALGDLLGAPSRPFVAVVGGAKVADKIGVLKALLHRVDVLVVGGGMAFTFLAAAGHDVGGSMIDVDRIDDCAALLASGKRILLPTDIVALEPDADFGCDCSEGEVRVVGNDVPTGWRGLDIGPATVEAYADAIGTAATVLWNGPMGVFEDSRFCNGTAGVARAVARCGGFTVVGGGDSAAAVDELGLDGQIDFISTGGGASLELLEHGDLPGLAALRAAPNAPLGRFPVHQGSPRVSSAQTGRRPLISGNWKMNFDHHEALHAARDLGLRLQPADVSRLDVSVHPPFTDLRTVQSVLEPDGVPVALGAQDCAIEDAGAFTGEVSPLMLAKLHVDYVIVGHSERRRLFGETDEVVRAKMRAVMRNAMTPICCVGESIEEREAGVTEDILAGQVKAALDGTAPEAVSGIVIAYEPLWAIGSGVAATPDDAQRACQWIREVVAQCANADAAQAVRIQYGGSVNDENTEAILGEPDIDGALVGGASLDVGKFLGIIRAASRSQQ